MELLLATAGAAQSDYNYLCPQIAPSACWASNTKEGRKRQIEHELCSLQMAQ
jgi:hypothetical protein